MHPENIYPTPNDPGHGQAPIEHHITGLEQHITGIEPATSHQPSPQPVSFSDMSNSSAIVSQPPSDVTQPPVGTSQLVTAEINDKPIAVLEVLSVRGVEYGMMTLVLWIGAITLAWVLLNVLNGSHAFSFLVVPTSALVVCVPVFGFFFLRLKKAELADPALKFDPSKRRWSQLTQILAYAAVLINLIFFVYTILQKTSGGSHTSIGKSLVNLLVILLVAGGILAYYWIDEHKLLK